MQRSISVSRWALLFAFLILAPLFLARPSFGQGPLRKAGPPRACEGDLGRVVSVGLATVGTGGLLELALVGMPIDGFPFRLEVRRGYPWAAGYLVIGDRESPVPLSVNGGLLHPSAPWQTQLFRIEDDGTS